MGAINPAAFYGAVRGYDEGVQHEQRTEAFNTDQAIRKSRLAEEEQLRPLRMRALQAAADSEEKERPLRMEHLQNQVDVSKLTKEQQQMLTKEMQAATARTYALRVALASGDPQKVADAMATAFPEAGIKNPAGRRNPDGSITFTAEGMPEKTYKGTKVKGTDEEVSPWEEMAYDVTNRLDPIKSVQAKFARIQKQEDELASEAVKQKGRVAIERLKEEGRTDKRSDAWVDRQHSRARGLINDALKTKSEIGQLILGYGNTEDASLRSTIGVVAAEYIDKQNLVAEEAVHRAINDVKKTYDGLQTQANKLSEALSEEGVDPRNPEAVKAAAGKGNKNAEQLLRRLAFAESKLGVGVRQHLVSQLKIKPKKK
jgi:hypothetical protein